MIGVYSSDYVSSFAGSLPFESFPSNGRRKAIRPDNPDIRRCSPTFTAINKGDMSWFRSKSVPYIALAERESSLSEGEGFLGNEQKKDYGSFTLNHSISLVFLLFLPELTDEKSERKRNKFTTALIAITIVLSIANLTFFIHQYISRASSESTKSDTDLELANAYIGLDKLHAFDPEATTPNYTIENMPLVVGSVDREHPNKVRPDETPHWWTFQGTVVPDRRHIFVNETVSHPIPLKQTDLNYYSRHRYQRSFNSAPKTSASKPAGRRSPSRPMRPSSTRPSSPRTTSRAPTASPRPPSPCTSGPWSLSCRAAASWSSTSHSSLSRTDRGGRRTWARLTRGRA